MWRRPSPPRSSSGAATRAEVPPVIPRYQRILFVVLLGSSVLMALYLLRLHHEHRRQLAALSDATPISAPYAADAEDITLAIANDADGSITPTERVDRSARRTRRPRPRSARASARRVRPAQLHASAHRRPIRRRRLPAPRRSAQPPKDPNASAYASEPSENQSLLAVINLHGAFVQGHPSGILPEMLTIQSILGTLHANLPQITQVRFLVDGQQVQTLAGHADLTRIYPVADTSTGRSTPTPASRTATHHEQHAPPSASSTPASADSPSCAPCSRSSPDANYVYLGDTARLPYGSKSRETIAHYAVDSRPLSRSPGCRAARRRLQHRLRARA